MCTLITPMITCYTVNHNDLNVVRTHKCGVLWVNIIIIFTILSLWYNLVIGFSLACIIKYTCFEGLLNWDALSSSFLEQISVAHWLHTGFWFQGSAVQNRVGENNFLFHFWLTILWFTFHFELICANAKWQIHEWIHHVWLSIRLNTLGAGIVAKW